MQPGYSWIDWYGLDRMRCCGFCFEGADARTTVIVRHRILKKLVCVITELATRTGQGFRLHPYISYRKIWGHAQIERFSTGTRWPWPCCCPHCWTRDSLRKPWYHVFRLIDWVRWYLAMCPSYKMDTGTTASLEADAVDVIEFGLTISWH